MPLNIRTHREYYWKLYISKIFLRKINLHLLISIGKRELQEGIFNYKNVDSLLRPWWVIPILQKFINHFCEWIAKLMRYFSNIINVWKSLSNFTTQKLLVFNAI